MSNNNNNKLSIEYNTRLPGFFDGKKQYITSIDGKIKTIHIACPQCQSSDYVDNGYHLVEDALIRECGLTIKIAQCHCKKCGTYWSIDHKIIDEIIQKHHDLIKGLLLGCARAKLSFVKSTKLIEEKIGTSYSPQYLYEIYTQSLEAIKQERFTTASGVYNYDEQHLKANGEETCRIVIKDYISDDVIADIQTSDAKKETIKKALKTALEDLPVEVFIIDMLPIYPELIHELFPTAKIQWCIFHLNKIIWRDLQEEYGRRIPLIQLYNAYKLFNIFFDHTKELEKLAELLKIFETQKNNKEIEKELRIEFAKFVKELKKERRREKKNIPRRTLEESEKIFSQINQQKSLYSKKIQKRIIYIEENWSKFTLFQRDTRVPPTNNGVEQYFAATLSKTDKKDFRSKKSVTRELNAAQAEWNGKKLFSTTNLIEILSLMGILFRAFQPT